MNKKIIVFVFLLTIIGFLLLENIQAETDTNDILDGYNKNIFNKYDENLETNGTKTLIRVRDRVVGTVLNLAQMLAAVGIVFTGIRYMYLGAKGKAELKNSLFSLMIGCIIIFSTTTIVKFVIKVFKQTI